jgi:hypothetical protein
MADLTAVTGNWHSTAGSSTAFGGVATTAADNITIPNGVTVTIPASVSVACRSLTVANGGTLVFAATTSQASIGDATLGTGNVALSIGATATITLTGLGTINFVSTNSTAQTITTNGKTLPNVTFNGVGGRWQLQDAVTCNQLSQTNGHLDTNSQNVTSLLWIQNNGTTTTTLGSTQWTVNGSGTSSVNISWSASGTHTFTANTATVTITSDSTTPSTASAGRDTNGLSIVFAPLSASSAVAFAGGTWRNVSRTGSGSITLSANLTVTGTLTLTGTNSTTNRMIVQSDALGTPRTITAAAVSLTDVDFMDITGAGAATWSGTRLGDCLGNSGITFQTSRTLYGVAAGNFSSSAMWSLTSGGTAGEPAPLPQDDVVLDASSAAGTYSMDVSRVCRNIDCTGFTRTLTPANASISIYGSLTFDPAMTLGSFNPNWYFVGRGNHTITSAGKVFSSSGGIRGVYFQALGGTYTLGDALTAGSPGGNGVRIHFNDGTFNSANYPISTTYEFQSTSGRTRTVNLGTSTVTLSASLGFDFSTPTGLTLNASDATFVLPASATNRTCAGGGFTFGTIDYTAADSTGALTFTGANTIGTLNVGAGRQVTFPANTITRVGDLNVSTTTVRSSTTGTSATLLITGAVDQHNGADWQDITLNGSDAFLGAQNAVRSNVKGVKRSPRYAGMMV